MKKKEQIRHLYRWVKYAYFEGFRDAQRLAKAHPDEKHHAQNEWLHSDASDERDA